MIEPEQIEKTVPASDPEVWRLLGIEDTGDPVQTAQRMVRGNQVPHLRIGRRIRFSLPALKKWAAEKLNNSVAASVVTE